MRYRPGGMEHAARLPFIDPESDYPCCWYYPALRLPREGFLVADRPSRSWPFDAADGFRYTTDGRIPVCVHPGRVGLQPERTAPPPATAPPLSRACTRLSLRLGAVDAGGGTGRVLRVRPRRNCPGPAYYLCPHRRCPSDRG